MSFDKDSTDDLIALSGGNLPTGDELEKNIARRQQVAKIWQNVLFVATIFGFFVLIVLMATIIDEAFGVVAMQSEIQEEELTDGVPLSELSQEQLIAIIEDNLRSSQVRILDREQPLAERSQEDLLDVIDAEILNTEVVESWPLSEALFNYELPDGIRAYVEPLPEEMVENLSRAELLSVLDSPAHYTDKINLMNNERAFESRNEAELREIVLREVVQTGPRYPNGELEWYSWLNAGFLTSTMSSTPAQAGIRTAIMGTLWLISITMIVAFPLGVGAAIYLEEYASTTKNPTLRRINDIIQTNINNLAGVPSIIYGILGLAIFVRALEFLTSGLAFGPIGAALGAPDDPTTASGRTIISAGLTLALLILPLIIINSQEAIRAVPTSLRQASYGLGATRWQTIWNHVLPVAVPGIVTGTILAMSRAIGETAPLIVVGAATFITSDPNGPFSKFTALPIQIYNWTAQPSAQFRDAASAGIIALLAILLTLNSIASYIRNRFRRSV